MAFKLIAQHKNGDKFEYGPWEPSPNPQMQVADLSFAHGFVRGVVSIVYPDSAPDDLSIEVVGVEAPAPPEATTVGEIKTWATASVAHLTQEDQ